MKRVVLPSLFIIYFLQTVVFFASAQTQGRVEDRYFSLYSRKNVDGSYDFFARNQNYCPYQVQVSFSEFTGAETSVSLPHYTVVDAQVKEQFLFNVKPNGKEPFNFKYAYNFWMGDPKQVIPYADPYYLLPYRSGTTLKVTQGYNGPYSHKGVHALDFELIESTAICAARDGIVIKTKEDSKKGGPDKKYVADCNYITVYHFDGTLAEYVHLKHNGSIVSVGDTVHAGQVIGYGGNTGWSTSPHLHFCVKQPTRMGYQSIPVKFVSAKSRRIALQQNRSYKAYPLHTDKNLAENRSWHHFFSTLFHTP
jgi:murein DD-endopeptidase MepM/ murein hydrolase activator NlpD